MRRPLNMAVDVESIAENYLQGWGDASVVGYFAPAEEWPDEVKQYYRYDPEAAEKLLDEAGYPRGGDGNRMSVMLQKYEFVDLCYYQIAMDYLRQIGIDVEIQIVPRAEWGIMGRGQQFTDLHFRGLGRRVWHAHGPDRCILVAKRVAPSECHRRGIRRVLRERAGRYHERRAAGVGG